MGCFESVVDALDFDLTTSLAFDSIAKGRGVMPAVVNKKQDFLTHHM